MAATSAYSIKAGEAIGADVVIGNGRICATLSILLTFGLLGASAPAAADALCGINFKSIDSLPSKAQASGRFTAIGGNGQWSSFASNGGLKILVVSTPENPAHPSAACRRAKRSKSGAWTVSTQISCQGPKAACDRLPGQFNALDKAMKAQLSGQ